MTTAPTDATQVMTSHLLLVSTTTREMVQRCSHCREPWPCAPRVDAEIVLYGTELPR